MDWFKSSEISSFSGWIDSRFLTNSASCSIQTFASEHWVSYYSVYWICFSFKSMASRSEACILWIIYSSFQLCSASRTSLSSSISSLKFLTSAWSFRSNLSWAFLSISSFSNFRIIDSIHSDTSSQASHFLTAAIASFRSLLAFIIFFAFSLSCYSYSYLWGEDLFRERGEAKAISELSL